MKILRGLLGIGLLAWCACLQYQVANLRESQRDLVRLNHENLSQIHEALRGEPGSPAMERVPNRE